MQRLVRLDLDSKLLDRAAWSCFWLFLDHGYWLLLGHVTCYLIILLDCYSTMLPCLLLHLDHVTWSGYLITILDLVLRRLTMLGRVNVGWSSLVYSLCRPMLLVHVVHSLCPHVAIFLDELCETVGRTVCALSTPVNGNVRKWFGHLRSQCECKVRCLDSSFGRSLDEDAKYRRSHWSSGYIARTVWLVFRHEGHQWEMAWIRAMRQLRIGGSKPPFIVRRWLLLICFTQFILCYCWVVVCWWITI